MKTGPSSMYNIPGDRKYAYILLETDLIWEGEPYIYAVYLDESKLEDDMAEFNAMKNGKRYWSETVELIA